MSPARRTAPLTREAIVDAAAAIVEGEGSEALTLRRLGAELGANHTAVLRHFSGKDEIVRGLAERLMTVALDGFAPAAHWRETLARLARRVRRACRAHPAVAAIASSRVSRSPAEFRGADTVVGALAEAGLQGREAALVYRAVTDLALAMGAAEAALLTLDEAAREGDRAALQREYLLASPAEYPRLAAVAPHLAGIDDDECFETALALVLDGVELRAGRVGAAEG